MGLYSCRERVCVYLRGKGCVVRRILVVPSLSYTSVANDEAYQEFYSLSRVILDSEEKAYWYFVIPSWIRDGLMGHDRICYVHMDSTRDPVVNSVSGFPALELARNFARRGGRNIVDAVLTDCSFFGVYLKKLLSDSEARPVPIVLRDHGRDPVVKDSPDEWSYLACSYMNCHAAVRSEFGKKVLSRLARRYLNASMAKLLLDRCIDWSVGYDVGKMSEISSNAIGKRGDMMFIGGDFESYMDKRDLFLLGKQVSLTGVADVSLASLSPVSKVERFFPNGDGSFLSTIRASLRPDEYYREASLCRFFVSVADRASCFEEFEREVALCLLGQVGVFPASDWIMDRVGGDYPLLYNVGCMDEAYALIVWVVQNKEEAKKIALKLKDKFIVEHDQHSVHYLFFERVLALIKNEYRIHKLKKFSGKKRPLFSIIYDVSQRLGDEFALDVFLDVLEEHVTWLKPWGRKGTLKSYGDVSIALPTLYDIREMLDNLGWVDTCEKSDIYLRREREPLPEVLEHV